MLSIKLEQAGTDSALGATNIDPKGYLTGLDSQLLKTSSEIGYVILFLPGSYSFC